MSHLESFTLSIAPGLSLAADLMRRPGRDVLVVLPGFWRTRRSSRIHALALKLAEQTSVAVLDLRGHGDSTGAYSFGTHEPSDVRALLAHLLGLGFSRVGLLGLSMGGTIAMEAARDVPAGIAIVGAALVSSPTHVRRARPFLTPAVLKQAQGAEIRRWPRISFLELVRPRELACDGRPAGESFPVAIFHARGDWLIPDTEAAEWARGLGARADVTLFELPGRLHADALLADGMELAGRLEAWWRGLSGKAKRAK